ncbi:SpoIIE family protein phosphatase [Cytophagales bacterium LB-30]|uniref:SpoIIE family protein phosphatase n=1 Tax=Shiella aurantiaca TaxID=3058365 RepID=A0ABT8F0D0_9BACT|nr:SpoIIE family protein phosphatase [Shiella aurantiaca]MDN4163885.1 SpoIIE family protein phosphatase [Shiella aurantiaca]
MRKILDFFLENPIRRKDDKTYRQARLIVTCALITALFDVFYTIISIIADFPQGVIALSLTCASYITNAFLFRTNVSNNILGNMYCAIFYVLIMVLGYYTGAIGNHSIILPWLTVVPAIALLLVNRMSAWTWLAICVAGFSALSLIDKENTPVFYNMEHDAILTVLLYSGLGLIALIINSVFEANKSMALTALELAHENIKDQNKELDKKNQKILSSINYSKRIQNAILPTDEKVKTIIPSSFIFFKPKDIVSGDFYWIEKRGSTSFIAAVDCTGHGVPGAFMSLIGNNILREIVSLNITSPNIILDRLHEGVTRVLQQHKTKNADGMDVSLCVFDEKTNTLEFSGAKNPLVYIEEDDLGKPQLIKLKGDSQCIGGAAKNRRPFTKHTLKIERPTFFYIFSDGLQDQFGGENCTKFMLSRMQELFLSIYTFDFEYQKQIIDKTLNDWIGLREKQIDDILVVGFKLEPTEVKTRYSTFTMSTTYHMVSNR